MSEAKNSRRIPGAWLAGPAIFLLLALSHAADPPRVEKGALLIVNSDMTVNKYAEAQSSFKESVDRPTTEIDLGTIANAGVLDNALKTIKPELVYCIGSKAYLMTHKLGKDRNIVLSSAINWQRFPVGPNTFGVSNELATGMQLTMFHYLFPDIKRIGVLYSKEFNSEWLGPAKVDAAALDVEIITKAVKRPRDLESALAELLPTVDGLWIIPDPVVLSDETSIQRIFTDSEAKRKPIFAYNIAFARRGAVMAIAPDVPTIGRQAAALAQRILDGTAVDERFQLPAGSEITVNLKVVRSYGLNLNEDALDSVNRILE